MFKILKKITTTLECQGLQIHYWITSKQEDKGNTSLSPERLSSANCSSTSFSDISFRALLISASALVCKIDKAS